MSISPKELNLGNQSSFETTRQIEPLSPQAQEALAYADEFLRSHEFVKGHSGILFVKPKIVTVEINVKDSKWDPEWMYKIGVKILPLRENLKPEIFNGAYVALNDGATPSKNDMWRLEAIDPSGSVGFDIIPRKAISGLRVVFPQEREALRQKRAEKIKR